MDLTNGLVSKTDEKITELAIKETNCPLLNPGTVLVAMYGGFNQIGRTGIMTIHGSINQAISAIIPDKKEAIPEYILHWLNGNIHLWRKFAASSRKDPNITQKDVGDFPIFLPPISEQRKITVILNTWDKTIRLVGKQIEAKQQLMKGLMQQLLTGKIIYPGFNNQWHKTVLSELVRPIIRNEVVNPSEDHRMLGVRLYVAGAHIHEILPGSQIATKTLSRIRENDIVYNKMWVTKQAFGIAREEHDGSYGSTEYPQFRAIEDKLDVNFLGYLFFDSRFQYDAQRLCQGTTGRARLNPKDFLKIEVYIPQLEQQKKISEILNNCDQEIKLLTKKLINLKALKRGLMQKLLTGEVRVKV